MGTKKGLIFGSCPETDWSFLSNITQWPDFVIAADGGLRNARAAGFAPNVYIGDGDSGGAPEDGLICVTLPPEKDVTDLEAAYRWARSHGCGELILTGCTGGRLDHHMAAMSLLELASQDGVRAVILDARNRVEFLSSGTHSIPDRGYRYVSLVPVDSVLAGLRISGAKYCLSDRDVYRGESLTISNEFADNTITVSFQAGCCYLIYAD